MIKMGRYYKDYADYLAEHFTGKMQKLTVNAGFSCPNRDGTIGRGGCVYCNNSSFSPELMAERQSGVNGVTAQLEAGKRFFEHKYPSMRYLAYFQSYTNTHGDAGRLLALYEEALAVDKVDGLIIGTRPDCVPDSLLRDIAALGKPVIMEYGAESSHDITLQTINRCHTWAQTVDAVQRSVELGLSVGLHFIMGLPGESREMMLQTVERAAALPIDTVKFHQLQIIKNTTLACETVTGEDGVMQFRGYSLHLFEVEEYVDLCVEMIETLNRLNPRIAIERFTSQAPADLLLAPRWGLKNYQFTNLLNNRLAAR
jgi:hypothetical protein